MEVVVRTSTAVGIVVGPPAPGHEMVEEAKMGGVAEALTWTCVVFVERDFCVLVLVGQGMGAREKMTQHQIERYCYPPSHCLLWP
jgi:hypothetical protein